jgi:[acyl-carrier-protein] S-malonyltransferase
VHAYAAAHQGEHLYTSERVVISPAAGVFEPLAGLAAPGPGGLSPTGADAPGGDGAPVAVGDLLGTVGTVEVRTPFAGMVVGFMAHRGERVAAGEPIAWLRVQADQ